eukprot:GHVN01017928.1.p1 GENE.GHVN01017928.1~~GHVN01017928.1.p1  ORF type:complete len:775 (-),score=63.09 GHVN01017928.1:199-2523(-)
MEHLADSDRNAYGEPDRQAYGSIESGPQSPETQATGSGGAEDEPMPGEDTEHQAPAPEKQDGISETGEGEEGTKIVYEDPKTEDGVDEEDDDEEDDRFKKGGEKDLSDGPKRNRKCTDVPCLIFFLISMLAFAGLLATGFILGDYRKLFVGTDVHGNYCGITAGWEGYQRAFYTMRPEGLDDLFRDNEPPDIEDIPRWEALIQNFQSVMNTVCTSYTEVCPTGEDIRQIYIANNNSRRISIANYPTPFFALPEEVCPYESKYCLPVPGNYSAIAEYWCVPLLFPADELVEKAVDRIWSYVPLEWTYAFAAVEETWPMFILMAFLALVASSFYFFFIQLCATVCAYLMVGLFVLTFLLGGAALMTYSQLKKGEIPNESYQFAFWGAIGLWIMGIVFTILIFLKMNAIREGAAIVKSTAIFLRLNKTVYIIPFITLAVQVSFALLMIFASMYLLTMDGFQDWEVWTFLFFTLLLYLWFAAWLTSISQTIIAGAVAWWYFIPVKENGRKRRAPGAVCRSTAQVWYYHLGSVAFGAFILAVIRIIKWFLRFLKRQKVLSTSNPDAAALNCLPCGLGAVCGALTCANGCVLWVLWAMSGLVECFERFLEFVSRQSFVQIAIQGKNFCQSAWEAFRLIRRHPGRFAVCHYLGKMLVMLGLLVIAGTSGIGGYFITTAIYGDRIATAMIPAVIQGCIGLLVTYATIGLLPVAIDAIMQCFLCDLEMAANDMDNPMFAPRPLQKLLEDGLEEDEQSIDEVDDEFDLEYKEHAKEDTGGCCAC